jgi:accessory gene regulator protein AgrB
MIWLWRDTHDPVRMAAHAQATFWFVLPSLPMFLLVPWMLRHGWSFWLALGLGCAVTIALYAAMVWAAARIDVTL